MRLAAFFADGERKREHARSSHVHEQNDNDFRNRMQGGRYPQAEPHRAERRHRFEEHRLKAPRRLHGADDERGSQNNGKVRREDSERLPEQTVVDTAFADVDVPPSAQDRPHARDDDREGAHLDSARRRTRASADEHENEHQKIPAVRKGGHSRGGKSRRTGRARLKEGAQETLTEIIIGKSGVIALEEQEERGGENDEHRTDTENELGVELHFVPAETAVPHVPPNAEAEPAREDEQRHGNRYERVCRIRR